jgi:MoxR-like ATPase
MATKITQIREALNKKFFERKELIDGMLTALLAREMLFMLGTPGTAKSAVCEALCGAIGGQYFTWLVSKFTTPEELFGPPSLKALEQDRYERVTAGKLPEAHVAFLDEIFKGSSAILNTLLPVINERVFHNGAKPTAIPLQCLFGASNEIPQAEELAALYDRFALRYSVERMASDTSAAGLFEMAAGQGQKVTIPTISVKELEAEHKAVDAVTVPASIIKLLVQIRSAVNGDGIYVSDRRWVQAIRVLKAYAYLNGATEVSEDHLDILKHSLWSVPEQQKTISKIINKFSNPLGEKITQYVDAARDVMELLKAGKVDAIEAHKKVKSGVDALTKLGDSKTNSKLKAAIEEVKQINVVICKDHLGLTT